MEYFEKKICGHFFLQECSFSSILIFVFGILQGNNKTSGSLCHCRYQTWMHFDDASVKVIGPDFSRVLAKCIKGHMQPLLLFYANPEFETIGDDVRYVAASDTSSCLSGKSSGMEPEEKRAAPVKPLPPRPPLRTVSRTSPYQQQHPTALINSSDQLTASSITTPAVVGSSNPHTSGDATDCIQ
jgi:hypothetical protein